MWVCQCSGVWVCWCTWQVRRCVGVLVYAAGKVVYGEVIAAALTADGSHYFNKCWRHAAGHVVSPPFRQGLLTAEQLLDFLSKSVYAENLQFCFIVFYFLLLIFYFNCCYISMFYSMFSLLHLEMLPIVKPTYHRGKMT